MCRAIVFTFDSEEKATQARAVLKELEKSHTVSIDDALVLMKDAHGHLHRRRDAPRAVIIGAGVGGLLGLVLTFMFPFVSIVFGVVVGGLIGWLFISPHADKELVADTEAALAPGASALIILYSSGAIGELAAALTGLSPHLYETTLSPDQQAKLERALQQRHHPAAEHIGLIGMPDGA